MKAILLLLSMFFTVSLFGMDFENFKQKALSQTNRLKSARLSMDIAQKSSKIMQQYQNPSLEVEGSNFDDEKGWRVGLSQSIRIPSIGSDLRDLATTKNEESKASFIQIKADFCKKLEIQYSEYVYQKKLESLINEELSLASRIEKIAKVRLQNGIGTKAQSMMVTLEKEDIQNRLIEQALSINKEYLTLLSLANILEDIDLEVEFIYTLSQNLFTKIAQNPTLTKIKKQQDRFEKESKALDHSIKSIELFGEFEKEPDQEVQRVGVALSVPLFNTNTQEAELAQIRATQSKLLLKELQLRQKLEIRILKSSILNLKKQYISAQNQQIKINKLLKLFEDGYRISKGSLLELIDIKNRVIQKKRKLLQIQKNANLKQIELNFIQGRYND